MRQCDCMLSYMLVPETKTDAYFSPRRRCGTLATMNVSESITSSVESLSFYSLGPDDIRRISVKQIINPVLLDDLNRPNPGGLYDPALGPASRSDMCALSWSLVSD